RPTRAPGPAWNRDSHGQRNLHRAGVLSIVSLLWSGGLLAQAAATAVNMQVKADQEEGLSKPIWNSFGYDEPNYTYSPNGKKLLGELAALSPLPVYIRTHNLFTSGDGSASLKWGSTNVYTEDASGKPIYDWTIVDRIFDTYQELGIKPLVELGFMPQALPAAHVGGPDTTGPVGNNAAEFLRVFLEHCAHQRNYATGKTGAPLHFISFHAKGAPTLENGRVRMGMRHQLAAIQRGFEIVTSFPEWRDTPIILGESDPEGCAACSAEKHPENAYRNGPLFASYTVAIL